MTCTYTETLKPGLWVTPGHRTDTDQSATYDFLLTFHSNHMGLSHTVSEINGDFSRKSQIFPHVLFVPAENVPLEVGIGAGDQKARLMGLPGLERSLTISLGVWIQCTNVTDGQTDTGRQQIPHLHIASVTLSKRVYRPPFFQINVKNCSL